MTNTDYKEIRTQTHREDYVKTPGEDSYLQAEERGFRRNEPYRKFDLGLPASVIMRK